jgi:4,5-dihydroxyphthalate decarboxylase
MTWYAAREEKMPIQLNGEVDRRVVDPEQDLESMLITGEIDVLVSTLIPDALGDNVERLFDDFKGAERDYYTETGVFPIMLTVIVHQDIYEAHPWVVNSLYDAMERAKEPAIDRLYNTDALHVTLPWLINHIEETRDVLGEDFWSYGFELNRHTLETLTRYSYEQGLSNRKVDPKELFVDELLDTGADSQTRVKPGDGSNV